VTYPEVTEETKPRHRFMSAYEQHVEVPNRQYQYLLFAAEPYETIAFKIQSREIDMRPGRFWTYWDKDTHKFTLQLFYRNQARQRQQDGSAYQQQHSQVNPLNPYILTGNEPPQL
ncbi:CWF complex protein sap62, partial [Linderina pennispora]